MPDKRQAFAHAAARGAPRGEVVVPPVGMAEVTPTRVPGERRLWPTVGGWAPYVPRVDDLLGVAGLRGAPLSLVTSFGTVTISPPPDLGRRLRARLWMTLHYAELAEERERALASPEPTDQRRYLERVRALGFQVALDDTAADLGGATFDAAGSMAVKFLGAALAVPFVAPSWISDPLSYALSPRGNSPPELAWFAWAILMLLLVRAAVILSRIERARGAVPLTIGGWGTRGKSGSERLKAALFQGLGYQTVVKTTGCEAMFIHAIPGVPAKEIFVYRPYDKSTIWEQRDLIALAARLGADVFLWECMALRERFIQLLLNEWMAGKISTITNAYPDHEDVMGPSGEDVARVIGEFMPKRGVTITAEEQMLPILRESARRSRTELHEISARESDLLAPDLLARFPYQEHPRNIALVARLAEHLGVDRDVALVEMADHVIPDLGVLKTYPAEVHRGRRVFFSNGMSANERAGFLANWTRLGLDAHDPDREPDLSLVTVVNNRADRVARSRVFAKIMVEDAPCERQVVIGTNLSGMQDFVRTALEEHLRGAWVRRGDDLERTLTRLDAALRRLKIATGPGALGASLRRMLLALPLPEPHAGALLAAPEIAAAIAAAEGGDEAAPDRLRAALEGPLAGAAPGEEDLRPDVLDHARRAAWRAARAARVRQAVRAAPTDDEANLAFRAAYRELFLETIVYSTYEAATGDQVLDFVTRSLAPGQRVHVIGVQNIKGTGLDFVYRWISVDKVEAELARMQEVPTARAEVLTFLLEHRDYGLLDARRARDALREVRRQAEHDPTWAPYRTQVEATLRRLEEVAEDRQARLTAGGREGSALLTWAEHQLDYLDAIRRRRLAQRVIDDLVAQRVSRDRAALLMREVTQRQKGGWLRQDLARAVSYFRRARG
jgi:poly-gamma-glutamate synthase PgsB/CapB